MFIFSEGIFEGCILILSKRYYYNKHLLYIIEFCHLLAIYNSIFCALKKKVSALYIFFVKITLISKIKVRQAVDYSMEAAHLRDKYKI
jgi:hypothetical protein